jgi:hypothetical protein
LGNLYSNTFKPIDIGENTLFSKADGKVVSVTSLPIAKDFLMI